MISPVMAKMLLGKTPLGAALEAARQNAIDPDTGETYKQTGVARALRALGKNVPDRSYASIENETQLAKPEIINEIPKILPISVLALVRAMGFDVTFDGIQDEEEVALLEAFRAASVRERRAARAVLGLPAGRPPSEGGRSLRRQAAMDRQDRLGTLE